MTNLLIFLFFFIILCLFAVIFVGMALYEHHSSELEPFDWEPADDDYPGNEDNVIFKA
ncbi:MAG: hypothetical protein NTX38_00955 [Methylobacter sp.]|nr:hypothetical protein [Methylobacter sp.]